MIRSRSTSRAEPARLAVALAAALAADPGCGADACEQPLPAVSLALDAPGGAAVRLRRKAQTERNWADATYTGTIHNNGAAPCRIAVHRHLTEPTPADLPTLSADTPAPATIGTDGALVFEALLPAARDGQVFVREIHLSPDVLEEYLPLGFYVWLDDPPYARDAWITVSTCAEPDLQLDLEFVGEVCSYPAQRQTWVALALAWPGP